MNKLIATAVSVGTALLLSSCSDASTADSSGSLTVGTIPNPSVVGIYLGNEQGMFEERGINVAPKVATGFAPNLAAVVNGESQIGFAAVVPLLVAKSKGAPIKIIAGADAAPMDYDPATDPDNVFTTADSGIEDPKDLEGKTVAVNALGSLQDLGVRIMVTEAGGDPDKVEFLALPSNDMIAALEGGQVDAAALSEPFGSAAQEQGLRALFSYVTSPTPGAPVGAYFTSDATLAGSGEQIDAFVAGIEAATEYAETNPEAVKKALPGYTQIPADVVDNVNTFPYDTEISAKQIDTLTQLLIKYEYMKSPVAAEDILR